MSGPARTLAILWILSAHRAIARTSPFNEDAVDLLHPERRTEATNGTDEVWLPASNETANAANGTDEGWLPASNETADATSGEEVNLTATRPRPRPRPRPKPSPSSPSFPSPSFPSTPSFPSPSFPSFPSFPSPSFPSPTFPSPSNPSLPSPSFPSPIGTPTLKSLWPIASRPTPCRRPSFQRPTTCKKRNTGSTCRVDGLCDLDEDCNTCPADCKRMDVRCGDGTCVEGENCRNCPQDCAGSVVEGFCCGDDGTSPDGCNDPRCDEGSFRCVTYRCEGLGRRASGSAHRGGVLLAGTALVSAVVTVLLI